ncbi:RimK family alpha-L-glutamate ligase [Streptomyces sp. NPDC059534]|uniref:ATP-grasp domain-containing protein n=1 Tax=Streptomyces sp. NPDC059534 TaxID=3346859 RepID=UPI00367890D7
MDHDQEGVLTALRKYGVHGELVNWDDPAINWSKYDLAVVRSTWDYVQRHTEFLRWVDQVDRDTRLCNPRSVLQRYTDKAYLKDLAAAGIATVPTVWIGPGETLAAEAAPWPELVIKPSVSCAGQDTLRTRDRSAAVAHIAGLTEIGRTALVQPCLPMVQEEGEVSLVFLGGKFSHAVRRYPRLVGQAADFHEDPCIGMVLPQPTADHLDLAQEALSVLPERDELLYARVDLVRDETGHPMLLELELVEPFLYLGFGPGATDRFAAALVAAVG